MMEKARPDTACVPEPRTVQASVHRRARLVVALRAVWLAERRRPIGRINEKVETRAVNDTASLSAMANAIIGTDGAFSTSSRKQGHAQRRVDRTIVCLVLENQSR
jgi:hypothetical protein